jgi:ubiquinone/menaquinone biosynthesis C-methylase UbiE
MNDREVLERMRADWNARARDDARYFVAFARRNQDAEEFQATAADVVRDLERELRRLPAGPGRTALEIGCGPGRLMRPLSRHFAEIHGVDVSDEMVRRARERLADVPHAHVHLNDGASLAAFAGDTFDFVYSYAVFQHIPSREVVFGYLREAWRVLKPGGYLRCQVNGLPPGLVVYGWRLVDGTYARQEPQAASSRYDTWEGVRIAASEIARFADEQSFQLLALEGQQTQYMWVTARKRPAGWRPAPATSLASVLRIANPYNSEPLVPARGRYACVSLWLENLPPDCDLNRLSATIGNMPAEPVYIGLPEVDGSQQVNIMLPQGIGTGLLPIEVSWQGRPLTTPVWLRVIPPGPAVPRLIAVSDAVELPSARIVSRGVRVVLDEVTEPEKLAVFVDGEPAAWLQYSCLDPLPPRYQVTFQLPASTAPGIRHVTLEAGSRRLPPIPIEVAP